jgi:hypothetical protein
VDRLATRLSNLVGVDDEVIAAGANMLLTFKGIRNEVGKGNRIFDQASAVILDMTAAMHQGEVSQQGLEKATIQVGKALNDPIKGITALTRVGVTFTQKQKDQIKALVEAGDKMGAQKIILGELKSEFGGAAAAAADPWQRFSVLMGNIKERIGAVLLPALVGVFGFLTKTLIPGVERFARRLSDAVGPAVSGLTGGIQEGFDTFKLDAKIFGRNLAARIKGTANAVIVGFQVGLKTGDWGQLGGIIGNILRQAIGNGIDLIRRAFGGVDWFKVGKEAVFVAVPFALGFFDALLDALFKTAKEHPGAAIGALLAFIPFGKLGGTIAKILEKIPFARAFAPLFRILESATAPLRQAAAKLGGLISQGLREGMERVFPTAAKTVRGRIGDLGAWISLRAEAFRKLGARMIRLLAAGIGEEIAQVVKDIGRVIAAVTRPFRGAAGWLIRHGIDAIRGLVRGIASALGLVGREAGIVISDLTRPFRAAGGWLIRAGRSLISGLVGGIRGALGAIGGVLRSVKDYIVGGIKDLFGIASPSTVMAGLGRNIILGLVRGLVTTRSSLQAIVKSIGGDVVDWFGGIFAGIGQGGTSGNLQKLAQRMAAGYGWTGTQWNALRTLVQNESGWNPNAQNPTSTAYGLFQFLNSTWASVGATKTSSPVGQIAAGLRYIKQRYGSPSAAYGAWLSRSPHWYGEGGIFTKPTVIGVGERGPEAVIPLNRGGGIDYDRLADAIVRALERRPPVVAVDDIHTGLLAKKRRQGRVALGLS